ncbi:putative UPF0481 protein At3g02645 [Pistacia vera]|uniref:putative UPF0481 protein At3g02645 n=1 Tax=Pistacia vera TaxID=55513 RepID=UPI001263C739|nr:putative UPF0481 protein At3g02645 [Pistacia vera]
MLLASDNNLFSAAEASGFEMENVVNEAWPNNLAINDDEKRFMHKVPRFHRKVNDEAYTPQLISIGPYHCLKEELQDMRMLKRRYRDAFFGRIIPDKQGELKNFILENEPRIRHHYVELPNDFKSNDDFNSIILHDAVFIIELFLRFYSGYKDDILLTEVWLAALRRDLQLLENQLPYFVLDELYKLARTYASRPTTENEVSPFEMPFSDLSGLFFQLHHSPNRSLHMQSVGVKIKHFTDLCRYALVEIPQNGRCKVRLRSLGALPNVVKLKNSGVKFQRRWGKYLVDIRLESTERLKPFPNKVKLQIPRIKIADNIECLIRNVMALEVCQYPSETYICSYIHLMDSLINNEQDVDLLVEKGIIYDPSGDYSTTSTMFDKLCKQIPQRHSHDYDIYKTLTDHYQSRWNHAMETLGSVYFSNPWRGTATVAAIILLLLTLAQTVASILQVV